MKSIIITLCGSGKFKTTFQEIYISLTKQGIVVLTPSIFDLCNLDSIEYSEAEYIHKNLDNIHETKILISDYVLIVNPKGYIGEDTRKEIEFAQSHNKQIIYFHENCSNIVEEIIPYIYNNSLRNKSGENLDRFLESSYYRLNSLEVKIKKLEGKINECCTYLKPYSYLQFVKDCQKALGILVTGIADKNTLEATIKISKTENNKHPVVLPIQRYLNYRGYDVGEEDCIFGSLTEKGLKSFQKQFMKVPDGVLHAGSRSWRELLKIN